MPLPSTKPSVPVKDKTSPDPTVRRHRDIDTNAIVNAFDVVDENLQALEDDLANIDPYNTNQFGQDIELKTALKTPAIAALATSVINFRSALTPYGTFAAPITGAITFDLIGAKTFSKAVVNIVSSTIPIPIADLITGVGGVPIIFEGDSFSTLETNINQLEFELRDLGVVLCRNKVYPGFSPVELNPNLFVSSDFADSGKDLEADPTLINNSIHAANYVFSISNPADALSIDLGGGKRALITARNADPSDSSRHQIAVDSTGISNWVPTNGITIVALTRQSALFNFTSIASNQDETETSGWRFTLGSSGQFRTRIQDVNITSAGGQVAINTEMYVAMCFNPATGLLKTFRMSADGTTIPFAIVDNTTAGLSGKVVAMTNRIWFERNNWASTTSLINKENFRIRILNQVLSDSDILSLMPPIS